MKGEYNIPFCMKTFTGEIPFDILRSRESCITNTFPSKSTAIPRGNWKVATPNAKPSDEPDVPVPAYVEPVALGVILRILLLP